MNRSIRRTAAGVAAALGLTVLGAVATAAPASAGFCCIAPPPPPPPPPIKQL